MAELVSKGPELKVTALRGLNLRKAKSQLEAGEFDRYFGAYPAKTGSASRMPGKELWHVFESGTTAEAVYQVCQAFMGQNANMIVQHGSSISLDSLDYYRNRVSSYSLTPTSTAAEAILGNSQVAGTYGGAVSSTGVENTFNPATLTIQSDSSGVILSCVNNVFQLGIGTYRIRAQVSFGSTPSATETYCRCGLYNVSNSQFQTNKGASTEIISTSGLAAKSNTGAAPASGLANNRMFLYGRFEVTAASESFSIRMAIASTPAGIAGSVAAQGCAIGITSLLTTGSKPELYSTINIYRE
jgi:hypothetical protein